MLYIAVNPVTLCPWNKLSHHVILSHFCFLPLHKSSWIIFTSLYAVMYRFILYLTALHIHKLNSSLMIVPDIESNSMSMSIIVLFLFPFLASQPPLLSITSGSSWLYVEWNAQLATFRVLYRESGAPDYQVIVPTTSQLSHNISALQPNTLYNIVVETTHTVTQDKVNSSVTRAYTTPHCELNGNFHHSLFSEIQQKIG